MAVGRVLIIAKPRAVCGRNPPAFPAISAAMPVPGNRVGSSDLLKALSLAVTASVGKPEQVCGGVRRGGCRSRQGLGYPCRTAEPAAGCGLKCACAFSGRILESQTVWVPAQAQQPEPRCVRRGRTQGPCRDQHGCGCAHTSLKGMPIVTALRLLLLSCSTHADTRVHAGSRYAMQCPAHMQHGGCPTELNRNRWIYHQPPSPSARRPTPAASPSPVDDDTDDS